ncbi:MAG: YcxB family protein [Chloroflexi bacterium]|nr:MAG: YcxB family protein [Chloroflexota bacterium]
MHIKTTLSKSTAVKLSLWLFFQNKGLYLYLLACAVITAYALYRDNYGLLMVAWIPYLFYVGLGIYSAFRHAGPRGADSEAVEYVVGEKGLVVQSAGQKKHFDWQEFGGWKRLAGTYVLFHRDGFMLAIPQADIPAGQTIPLETTLRRYIQP